ncbi:MAG: TROVE domain-containing protein [Candidatus Thermochlorobacter sp.]
MSKFNGTTETERLVKNLAGGTAFKVSAKLELASLILTQFVQQQFFRTETQMLERLYDLVEAIDDKQFAAKAAIYARHAFGMRSITHQLAAILGFKVKRETWTKSFFEKVVRRPDDITEILACYIHRFGKPIPNSMKKGLGAAFAKFDGYQLAKYRSARKAFSLIDAVNLLHPTPTDKNREALQALVQNKLRSTGTWETALSQTGQIAAQDGLHEDKVLALKKEAWAQLIYSHKLGYFALLRNLRNILEACEDNDALLDAVLAQLVDPKLIETSLVLPFRFITALEAIEKTNFSGTKKVVEALSQAVDIALRNVPIFAGKTLVALDVSGSMQGRPATIGSLFAAALLKSNDADLMTFSDDAEYQTLNLQETTLSLARSIRFASGGTNFHAIFKRANRKYNRIIILSDMQGWKGIGAPTSVFEEYKSQFKASPKIYSFDLQGYGTLHFPEEEVYAIAGFSAKTFEVMKLLETDKHALIDSIESQLL